MKQPVPYKRIIFVCVNQRADGACCSEGGEKVREELKTYAKSKGLKGIVRVSKSGCLDQCALGPNVMIFPDNIWYSRVGEHELKEIKQLYIDPLAKS